MSAGLCNSRKKLSEGTKLNK